MRRALLAAGGLMLLLPALRGDEPQPADQIKALIADYNKTNQEVLKAYREAKTPEERTSILKKRPNPAAYAPKLLALAQKDPKDPTSGQALLWITNNLPRGPQAKTALGLIIEHHAKNPAIGPALDQIANADDSRLDKFFQLVAAENPDANAKAKAAALGKLLVGKVAPDIVGEDIDGKPFKLSDYRGKVVMLDFWGHW